MTTADFKMQMQEQSLKRLHQISTSRNIKIVVEGDSWFDYPPQKDIIDYLIKMGYAISRQTNKAKHGDHLENMVYGSEHQVHGKFQSVSNPGNLSLQETLLAIKKHQPKFVLFSAGGNDIIGEELIFHLNHALSGQELLRETAFIHHVNGPMKKAVTHFIQAVTKRQSDIQIIMDGYDYAIPNGKPVTILGLKLSGPWILPSMGKKGITTRKDQQLIIRKMVDIFNSMLQQLEMEHPNFHYIDLRGMFPNPNDWHIEIHLKKSGYQKVAQLYHQRICSIIKFNPLT